MGAGAQGQDNCRIPEAALSIIDSAYQLQAWLEFLDYLREGEPSARLSSRHKSRRELQTRLRDRRNGNHPVDNSPTG